ncbi:hypothetical protein [Phenylobacterium montanum]|uniref:Uncharacterized protein n=1 Tax=Phenylobacterium montanum TaxID=2823693 RepID=A0A975G4V4_9CAUL|nr:hypothetical protein [Caulobacter sp. S6]QUD90567.1 hypothetical protein KCG34_12200 [Caulobacter sp. S6]
MNNHHQRRRRRLHDAAAKSLSTSDLDRELAKQRELGRRTAENAIRLRARLSNMSFAPPRRDLLADRDILQRIHTFLDNHAVVRVTGKEGPPVRRLSTPSLNQTDLMKRFKKIERTGWSARKLERPFYEHDKEQLERCLKRIRRRLPKSERHQQFIWLPDWTHTGAMLKVWACSMVVQKEGGWATSINLSDDVVNAAKSCPRGFTWYIQDLIQRELKSAFAASGFDAPDFFFVIEASEFHQAHLHGGVSPSLHPEAKTLVRDALFRIGRHAERTGREVHTISMRTATNWAAYITKWFFSTQHLLKGPAFTATKKMRSRARAWYQAARRSERAFLAYELDGDLLELFELNRSARSLQAT